MHNFIVFVVSAAAAVFAAPACAHPDAAMSALLHGYAHVRDIAAAAPLAYPLGLLAASAVLLVAGRSIGARMAASTGLRIAGIGVAGAGVWLLAAA